MCRILSMPNLSMAGGFSSSAGNLPYSVDAKSLDGGVVQFVGWVCAVYESFVLCCAKSLYGGVVQFVGWVCAVYESFVLSCAKSLYGRVVGRLGMCRILSMPNLSMAGVFVGWVCGMFCDL